MAVGIRPDEVFNAREVYADIIDLPRWEPNSRHPRMSLYKRAAQFAPFAALSGFDEMVKEEMRQADRRIEPDEDQLNLLNQQLNLLRSATANGDRPVVSITYFIPDEHKEGGRYVTVTARVKRIDTVNRKMFLLPQGQQETPEAIEFDKLFALKGDLFDCLEDDW